MFIYVLTEIILLPQLLVTMHGYCLHWLISISLSVFYQPCKFMTGEMVPMESSKSVVGTRYCSHCQYTSLQGAHCRHHNHSLSFVLFHFFLQLFPPPMHPTLYPFHPPLYVCWPKIDALLDKNHLKVTIICYCLFARLVVYSFCSAC